MFSQIAMGRIAILGATSQIARDFIRDHNGPSLALFSRKPDVVADWLARNEIFGPSSYAYDEFPGGFFDAIINFVGSGDPARTASMGAEILDVTHTFDDLALDYLRRHPRTRYIFLSSGAAFGTTFLEPASEATCATVPLNALSLRDYYGIAKLYAEARHRAMADHAIVDIRIFAYFSRFLDIEGRFFTTDALRAVREHRELETGSDTMYRDYIGPRDLSALVNAILHAEERNAAVDTFSIAPVEKFALLDSMHKAFGLRYRVVERPPVVRSTGAKAQYFSTNRAAASFGYKPSLTAQDTVLQEGAALLARCAGVA